jgi:hypothetical protein
LGISDDTVRRVVARDEEARKAREETPPELEYVPFDADYESERIAANAAVAPVLTELLAAETAAKTKNSVRQVMSSLELEMRQSADETPQTDTAECRSPELENDTPQPLQTPQLLAQRDELEDEPVVALPMPQPVRERVRVVRIPAEPPRRGIYDRLADVQIESFMGPELGLIVAVILIAMTFWGLG